MQWQEEVVVFKGRDGFIDQTGEGAKEVRPAWSRVTAEELR